MKHEKCINIQQWVELRIKLTLCSFWKCQSTQGNVAPPGSEREVTASRWSGTALTAATQMYPGTARAGKSTSDPDLVCPLGQRSVTLCWSESLLVDLVALAYRLLHAKIIKNRIIILTPVVHLLLNEMILISTGKLFINIQNCKISYYVEKSSFTRVDK